MVDARELIGSASELAASAQLRRSPTLEFGLRTMRSR
jgi:hypothetical protein